ncbi:hypothetical protein PTSG_07620 [Salpingoeca rosetta]|uniref:Arf-GAP domain-containing protein n=1 Tax=Salpingoeca rosetta (strain ATCC 50818 / BSB-021) TaxID=946362 RepID=F2UHA4_SALR5|nr:uncharacterized protein PTSG_07620 [Salpingoeca rosetta]EGD76503.1 hypothetical protein PTSG_07620 [Salpingoeca rosetta]|eukprot:XP_004991417.1 hypothetical protein PTSG_07620 [Salpingoeca rosetta]
MADHVSDAALLDEMASGMEEIDVPDMPNASGVKVDDPVFYTELDRAVARAQQCQDYTLQIQAKMRTLLAAAEEHRRACHDLAMMLSISSHEFKLHHATNEEEPLKACSQLLKEMYDIVDVKLNKIAQKFKTLTDCKEQMIQSHNKYTTTMTKFCATGFGDDKSASEDFHRRSHKAYAHKKAAHLTAINCVDVLHEVMSLTKVDVVLEMMKAVTAEAAFFNKGASIADKHMQKMDARHEIMQNVQLRAEGAHTIELQKLERLRQDILSCYDQEVAFIPREFEKSHGLSATLKRAVRKQDTSPRRGISRKISASKQWRRSRRRGTNEPVEELKDVHGLTIHLKDQPSDDATEAAPPTQIIKDKRGYMFRRVDKKWRLDFLAIENHCLVRVGDNGATETLVNLLLATIRAGDNTTDDRHHCLKIITPSSALGTKEYNEWLLALQQGIADALDTGNADNKDDKVTQDPVALLASIPGNDHCADCGAADTEWASINLGILLCIECSGTHRSLGVHISKVRSVHLDRWTQDTLEFMQQVGNDRFNARYEGRLQEAGHQKPTPATPKGARNEFIRHKYIDKLYEDTTVPDPVPSSSLDHDKNMLHANDDDDDDDDDNEDGPLDGDSAPSAHGAQGHGGDHVMAAEDGVLRRTRGSREHRNRLCGMHGDDWEQYAMQQQSSDWTQQDGSDSHEHDDTLVAVEYASSLHHHHGNQQQQQQQQTHDYSSESDASPRSRRRSSFSASSTAGTVARLVRNAATRRKSSPMSRFRHRRRTSQTGDSYDDDGDEPLCTVEELDPATRHSIGDVSERSKSSRRNRLRPHTPRMLKRFSLSNAASTRTSGPSEKKLARLLDHLQETHSDDDDSLDEDEEDVRAVEDIDLRTHGEQQQHTSDGAHARHQHNNGRDSSSDTSRERDGRSRTRAATIASSTKPAATRAVLANPACSARMREWEPGCSSSSLRLIDADFEAMDRGEVELGSRVGSPAVSLTYSTSSTTNNDDTSPQAHDPSHHKQQQQQQHQQQQHQQQRRHHSYQAAVAERTATSGNSGGSGSTTASTTGSATMPRRLHQCPVRRPTSRGTSRGSSSAFVRGASNGALQVVHGQSKTAASAGSTAHPPASRTSSSSTTATHMSVQQQQQQQQQPTRTPSSRSGEMSLFSKIMARESGRTSPQEPEESVLREDAGHMSLDASMATPHHQHEQKQRQQQQPPRRTQTQASGASLASQRSPSTKSSASTTSTGSSNATNGDKDLVSQQQKQQATHFTQSTHTTPSTDTATTTTTLTTDSRKPAARTPPGTSQQHLSVQRAKRDSNTCVSVPRATAPEAAMATTAAASKGNSQTFINQLEQHLSHRIASKHTGYVIRPASRERGSRNRTHTSAAERPAVPARTSNASCGVVERRHTQTVLGASLDANTMRLLHSSGNTKDQQDQHGRNGGNHQHHHHQHRHRHDEDHHQQQQQQKQEQKPAPASPPRRMSHAARAASRTMPTRSTAL